MEITLECCDAFARALLIEYWRGNLAHNARNWKCSFDHVHASYVFLDHGFLRILDYIVDNAPKFLDGQIECELEVGVEFCMIYDIFHSWTSDFCEKQYHDPLNDFQRRMNDDICHNCMVWFFDEPFGYVASGHCYEGFDIHMYHR